MAMDETQREHFREAVDKKNEEAAERAHADAAGHSAAANEQQLIDTDETQDTYSVRDKSSGHGKKTADKWNQ
jgi:hypothetical protein